MAHKSLLAILIAGFSVGLSAALGVIRRQSNDGIALPSGFAPHCGVSSGTATDINENVPSITSFKTIVAFGDSYTNGGAHDGTTQPPAVITGTNPKAGGRTTNGPVWIEDIATDIKATFMDYAIGGAVTDNSLWPSKANASSFIEQVSLFRSQNHTLSSSTTLYVVFFGINDYSASSTDGTANLAKAAQTILNQINILRQAPTSAKNFLIADDHARGGTDKSAGSAFKQSVFAGLSSLSINWAFVDFKYIWESVVGSSSVKSADGLSQWTFQSFGYASNGDCTVNSSTTVGECSDPAHTFCWIPGHPSKETHRIMADYTKNVLAQC